MRRTALKRTFGVVVPLLLLLGPGCARPRSVGSYFGNRGRDFAECFKGSAGYGWGVHARVEAIVIGAGMGLARGRKYGWDGAGGVGRAAWNKIAASAWLPILFEYNVDARGVTPGAALGPFTELHLADKTRPDLPAELVLLRGDAVKTGYNWRLQKRPVPKWTRWNQAHRQVKVLHDHTADQPHRDGANRDVLVQQQDGRYRDYVKKAQPGRRVCVDFFDVQ